MQRAEYVRFNPDPGIQALADDHRVRHVERLAPFVRQAGIVAVDGQRRIEPPETEQFRVPRHAAPSLPVDFGLQVVVVVCALATPPVDEHVQVTV